MEKVAGFPTVFNSTRDFDDYEIIAVFPHKEGVSRVIIKRDLIEHQKAEAIYCKNHFIPKDIDAHNHYWSRRSR